MNENSYKLWICEDPECGHEVLSPEQPQDIHWTDEHSCKFILKEEDQK